MAIPEMIRKIMDIIQEFAKELAVVEGSDTETGKAACRCFRSGSFGATG